MSKQDAIHVRGGATNATAPNWMEHSRFALVNSNIDPIRALTLIRFDTLRQDFRCLQSGTHSPYTRSASYALSGTVGDPHRRGACNEPNSSHEVARHEFGEASARPTLLAKSSVYAQEDVCNGKSK